MGNGRDRHAHPKCTKGSGADVVAGSTLAMSVPRDPPAALQTPGFAHYSIAWSPFHNTRIALASAANFGLVGNGRLHLVSLLPGPGGGIQIKPNKQSVHPYFLSRHIA